MAFVDFGRQVINKILDYAVGVTFEAKLLPYPTLITHILEKQDTFPRDDEVVIKTRRHQLEYTIGQMPNDFLQSEIPKARALAQEIRQLHLGVNIVLQKLIEDILVQKRIVAQALALIPRFFDPSDEDDRKPLLS